MSLTYLIILCILGWGFGSFFYKPANDVMHPIMVTTTVTLVYIIMTPLAFAFVKFDKTITWPGVIFSILGGTCMAIGSISYFFALKKAGSAVGEITAITSLSIAVTMILSMLFLHEEMTLRKGVGMVLAIITFIVLSWK